MLLHTRDLVVNDEIYPSPNRGCWSADRWPAGRRDNRSWGNEPNDTGGELSGAADFSGLSSLSADAAGASPHDGLYHEHALQQTLQRAISPFVFRRV
jgi:hypothetical protein